MLRSTLRYFRLLSWYWEARLWYRLALLLSNFLAFLWLGLGTFIAMSLLTAALILWLWDKVGGASALCLGAGVWLLGGALGWYWGRVYLRRVLSLPEAYMRMQMAHAALRIMEEAQLLVPRSAGDSPLVRWLLPLGLRWLWTLVKRLFRQWVS